MSQLTIGACSGIMTTSHKQLYPPVKILILMNAPALNWSLRSSFISWALSWWSSYSLFIGYVAELAGICIGARGSFECHAGMPRQRWYFGGSFWEDYIPVARECTILFLEWPLIPYKRWSFAHSAPVTLRTTSHSLRVLV